MKKMEEKVIEEEETTSSVRTRTSVKHRLIRPRSEHKNEHVPAEDKEAEEQV